MIGMAQDRTLQLLPKKGRALLFAGEPQSEDELVVVCATDDDRRQRVYRLHATLLLDYGRRNTLWRVQPSSCLSIVLIYEPERLSVGKGRRGRTGSEACLEASCVSKMPYVDRCQAHAPSIS